MNATTASPTSNGYTTDSPTSPVSNKCIFINSSYSTNTPSADVIRTTQQPNGAAHVDHVSVAGSADQNNDPSTPKKSILDVLIKKNLYSPRGCDIRSMQIHSEPGSLKLLKDRYLVRNERTSTPSVSPTTTTTTSGDTRSSYKHFVDLSSSNLQCVDLHNGKNYVCKIINEPLHKAQMAYFKLQYDDCKCKIYDHQLVRSVRELVPMSANRTYTIVQNSPEIYEDLHTYIRNKRRLSEKEAQSLFHQICQTVHLCHRNGIILRDLKLKRFFFIDEERTKIQYESLEGSMILDDPQDDTLYEKIGCPLYTAPELLCPNSTYAGKPADMWSLGVILYTMLVGQYPFYEKGGSNLIAIIRHCQVHIPNVLSKEVRFLLRNLLRRIPEERLQAEHLFVHPWLAELKPAYMHITLDSVFLESESESENEGENKNKKKANKNTDNNADFERKSKRPKMDYFDDNSAQFWMYKSGEMG